MRILPLLFSIGIICSSFVAHEFHVSKCHIDFNTEEKALQISMHLFIDDTEEALRKESQEKLFLCTEKETEEAETHLLQYLKKNFRIVVNEASADYDYIGKETSEDLQAVWVYLEIPGVEKIEQIEITNSVLTESFEDQKNIVSLSVPPNGQKYFILDSGKSSERITY